ncbi:DUF3299 domain-containing protein [Flexibacterium corallicola]|uniref:DUF3299 domain-containing protein n=1 Tax=Flexibacterium corallicola TaxID=3037259 RepID=UPI00286F7BD5|nr:DUF3299 domain-containing protein [Pseudovibrio sp. M1P-2-3]
MELYWEDLEPAEGEGIIVGDPNGAQNEQFSENANGFSQSLTYSLTDKFNDKLVRLPGFVIPLDFESTRISTFILAPFVGACIHMPPPPPNQLVLVNAKQPYATEGFFEPVYVTGRFKLTATDTDLAQIGYTLTADKIEPYE